jgi:hypothetical protein
LDDLLDGFLFLMMDKDSIEDIALMIGSFCICGAIILSDFVDFLVDITNTID